MEETKKKKKKKGRGRKSVVAGGILGVIVYLLVTGSLSFDFLIGGDSMDSRPEEIQQSTDAGSEDEMSKKTTVEIIGNRIMVNEVEVQATDLLEQLNGVKEVIFKIGEAKQITYDEVKKILHDQSIVLIEEQ